MTLRELGSLLGDEIEVWDKEVDISIPYYFYGVNCFEDNDEERDLHLMENWFLSLPVESINGYTCTVDVFSRVKENWDHIVAMMKKDPSYFSFLSCFSDPNDDEAIAEFTEDIFTCLSQGFYGFAKDFVSFFSLDKD